jgi:hypothetical protein
MLKTIIFVVACLCLFSAQALAQTTTTQTVEANNASVAFVGDPVGTFIGTAPPVRRPRSYPQPH